MGAEHSTTLSTNEEYQALITAAGDLGEVVLLVEAGRVRSLNGALARLTGFAQAELDAFPSLLELVPESARGPLTARLSAKVALGGADTFSTSVRCKDGATLEMEASITTVPGDGRKRLVIARDVTERRRSEAELTHLALHDPLTELPNRGLLIDRLQQGMLAAQRVHGTLALLVLDLDRFKEVNDEHGHPAGDELLREVARRLRGVVRAADTVARLGGDEFAIVLPGAGRQGALRAAVTIHDLIERPVRHDEHDIEIPSSIGVAVYPEHGRDPATLVRRADIAMYAAKRAGGGHMLFAVEQEASGVRRRTLVSELRRAIDRREIVLHYQPIIDLRTGRTTALEALARWQHPERGILPPALFIPLAEQSGLIKPLTRYVIERALRQCRAWRTRRHEVSMSVNVSMRNLLDPELPHAVVTLLAEAGAEPDWLTLEIAETAVMADRERALATMSAFRAIGVRIAIDDFGTGYSSLAYLHSLTADQVKIDRSFVSGLGTDRANAAIVRAAIDVGHDLGFEVVAEGVDEQASWQYLAQAGCDLAQGFYIARPMPPAETERWLNAYDPAARRREFPPSPDAR